MYDSLKRLIRADNPEQETLSSLNLTDPVTGHSNWTLKYEYDNNGNLTFKTDARGTVTENRYDELNRLTTVLYRINGQPGPNTGDIQYVYDNATNGKGRLWLTYRWGAKPSHTSVGEYDPMGRVKQLWNLFGDGVGGWSAGYGVSRNYNLAGQVTSQTYPSGRTVNYAYDGAGRTTGFTGNLGDGTTRSYASSFVYNARSQVTQELFGTATPLYHKLQYNIRGQLWDVRVSTNADVNGSLNRGGFQFFYEGNLGYGTSGPDNNGNVLFANTYSPEDENEVHWAISRQRYNYDSLNRLKSVTEYFVNYNHPESQQSVQTYDYDRWGNRTINTGQTSGTGINNRAFEVETARNRLYSPGDLALPDNQRRIAYDKTGNQIKDTYTGYGTATYDGDNHIVAIEDKFGGSSTYTYNANGQRVRRRINNQETWQIYGIDGELVAEYAANAPSGTPQKEYGYRDGQLLITADAPNRTNVALPANGGSAAASSYLGAPYNYYASYVNDGQRTAAHENIWLDNTYQSFPDWVEVDFNGTKTINEIDVVTQQDSNNNPVEPTLATTFTTWGITAFDVQYWNGTSWVTVPNGSVSGNNKVWRQFTFANITTSKIRVTVNAGVDNVYSRVVEVEAWGGDTGNSSATIHWLVPDHLGTPRIILDQTGSFANVKRHDYLPFGEELSAGTGGRTTAMGYVAGDNVRQQFTQKEWDVETGLDYFGARYYASAQGRFTSADSYGGRLVNPQTLNLYTYVRNNPLKYGDPTGHQDETPKKKGKRGNDDVGEEFLNTEDTPEIVVITVSGLGEPPPPPVLSRLNQMSFQFNNFMLRQTLRFASGGPIIMAAEGLLPKEWIDTWHSPGVQIPLMMSVVGSPLAVEAGAEEVTAAMEGEVDALFEISVDSVVVRGGTKELPPAGEVFSGAVGKTIEDAAAFVPHGTIRSTTVGAIESNGGTVVLKPELTRTGELNPRHVNITEGAHGPSTFSQPFQNPVPSKSRMH